MDTVSPGQPASRGAWAWIPTLYFAQGIPYVVVMTMSVIMYKRLGVSNADIALYTSWLYLPWVIKPLWSPLVELLGTKRQWIVLMQLLVGAALGCVALTLPGPAFFRVTLGIFWLLAFASATHDIAADGFYMLALNKHDQAWFVGVRSTFYRLAMIAGQGLLIMLAGTIETHTGLPAIELKVAAVPGAAAPAPVDPASAPSPAATGAPVRLIAQPTLLALDPSPRTSGEVNDLLARAKQWNQAAGFYAAPDSAATPAAGAVGPSWWSRNVAAPFGDFLRRNFAAKSATAKRSDVAGQAGVFLISLSARPDRDVVVTLGRESGDAGIKLLEGERFTFTATNWNKPLMAVVQLDPKNRQPTEATLLARAGNIPLAWSITFYALAGLFVTLFVYHRFVLPRPAADTAVTAVTRRNPLVEFFATFGAFFRKNDVGRSLAFLLRGPGGTIVPPSGWELALAYGDARGEAEPFLAAAHAKRPNDPKALLGRAQLRRLEGRTAEFVADLRRAALANPAPQVRQGILEILRSACRSGLAEACRALETLQGQAPAPQRQIP